jgi:hypothetical protein
MKGRFLIRQARKVLYLPLGKSLIENKAKRLAKMQNPVPKQGNPREHLIREFTGISLLVVGRLHFNLHIHTIHILHT